MASSVKPGNLLDLLGGLIVGGDWQRLEEAWLDNIALVPTTPEFLKTFLQTFAKADGADAIARAEALVVLLVEDRLERAMHKEALRVLLAALPSFPKSEPLRPLLILALRTQYGQLDQLDAIIQASGLEKPGSLVAAYKQFRDWTRLAPGQVYRHYDWGEGIVQQLDLATGKVTLEFPRDTVKSLTIDGVKNFLAWLEPKHFLARRAKEPEALLSLGEEKPVELIKLALATQPGGELRQADLKALITPTVIPERLWNSWWGRAREGLALDPYVDFDRAGGARALLKLREQPRTFAQEIEEGFFNPDVGPSGRAELLRQLAKLPKDALPIDLIGRMAKRLREEWALAADGPLAARLETAYMLQDLAAASPAARIEAPAAEPLLDGVDDYRVLFAVDHPDYGVRALRRLIERDGDEGVDHAASLLPEAPVKFAQAIWDSMDADQQADMGVQGLQKLFDNALENPDAYAWAIKGALDGGWKHLEAEFPPQAMVPELIDQMEAWHRIAEDSSHPRDRREAARKLLSRGRTLLGADHCELISVAVEGMTREMAQRLKRRLEAHGAFNAAFKAQAQRAIGATRRDLNEGDESGGKNAEAASDGFFFCTAKAQTKAMAELRDISSNRIPKNAKVIEEARMEGDLRENAGYQYAKEEQKMLVQQQATLSDLLSRCRVLTASEVEPSRIGFGTRFTVLNKDSGENETYTLMGRWEADADRNILSDQAPLARQFGGRKAGEKLTIQRPGAPATDYEILKIENALADPEWTMTES